MIDYSKFELSRNRFIREDLNPDEIPEVFSIPGPTIVGHIDPTIFKATIDGLSADGVQSYTNNSYVTGDIEHAFRVYKAEDTPQFSEALWVLTKQMIALAATSTENFDQLHPQGHKVRINAHNYEPWFEKEHEASWKRPTWKAHYSPVVLASSEAAIDFIVGEVPTDDPDLIYERQYQEPTLFGWRWRKNPKRTRHEVSFKNWAFEDMTDQQITEKGLAITTLEPGQVAMAGLGHIMRRRAKHEPGTAYIQLKYARTYF